MRSARVGEAIAKLEEEKGLVSPYLRSFVVALHQPAAMD